MTTDQPTPEPKEHDWMECWTSWAGDTWVCKACGTVRVTGDEDDHDCPGRADAPQGQDPNDPEYIPF